MSAYTPPALTAVDFALEAATPADVTPYNIGLTSYTPPALNAVDFALVAYTQPTFPYIGWELLPGGGGGPTIIDADAAAAGISAVTGIAAAVASALAEVAGAATTNGTAAAVLPAVGAAAGAATTNGISATVIAAVASSSAGATAQADAEAVTAVATPRGFQMDYGVFSKPRRRKDEQEKVVPNYDEEIAVLLLAA